MASATMESLALFACTLCLMIGTCSTRLTPHFYSKSCPQVFDVVGSVVYAAVSKERRMGASLLRLHFHDCFVNGCDGSILLDDTHTFKGEKTAAPNNNSARGFEVIDMIKDGIERVCPGVVSCADILAITALKSVIALGGPAWKVKLGRRDSRTASWAAANGGAIPPPQSSLRTLINTFRAVGLSAHDMVALAGAHTIGLARCTSFRTRIYNESNIDPLFATLHQSSCPQSASDSNLTPLDVITPHHFDNHYYKNLIRQQGLLHSDQQLHSGGSTDSLVENYSINPVSFYEDFANAMIKMGDTRPLTGKKGEIRKNCRLGGPAWKVKLGRRDSRTASWAAANGGAIPPPQSSLRTLINTFRAVGLSAHDMVALAGAHTIGLARCTSFRTRIYNESNIDPLFATLHQSSCPQSASDSNLTPLDVITPHHFDNHYYKNLIRQQGLLHSDQQLHSGGSTDSLVENYSINPVSFYEDFANAMIKMGDIRPLTGKKGEIRKNCRVVNS